jgi:hypothetical protein
LHQRGDTLLRRQETNSIYKLILSALVVVVLALTAQACGGKEKEVSITQSPTPVETPMPTIINTQTPVITLEPTTVPTQEQTYTPNVSQTATLTPVPVPTVSVEDVKLKLDSGQDFTLVDVRDASAFDESHIDTAISIPLSELFDRYNEITQDFETIVYTECS